MINVYVFRNDKNEICGFKLSGHAGFADKGEDIVCSAVSALVLNTVNSIEKFTSEVFSCEASEDGGGFLSFCFDKKAGISEDAKLLVQSMFLGLNDIKKEYGKFIDIHDD
ncbi:MAG: ribosomal-processing cysteine protease Prp [Lachnospiraceae bacterium]|nr:ribosomal-processing cysteine protease Prp [Lachnospiraceae bacterium]